jgi:hypothetical protein
MRIRLDDRSLSRDLVRHFRGRGYLAVERERGVVEVLPIDASDARDDRARTLADLAAWSRAHGGAGAAPLPESRE